MWLVVAAALRRSSVVKLADREPVVREQNSADRACLPALADSDVRRRQRFSTLLTWSSPTFDYADGLVE
jgi:hypothetical protein